MKLKTLNAGHYRHVGNFYNNSLAVKDDTGQVLQDALLLGSYHFALEPMSGVEMFQPTQVISECTHMILLRFADQRITPASWLVWQLTTTILLPISIGVQTVIPDSMEGIYVGSTLPITDGINSENVVVTAADTLTFTATFTKTYNASAICVYYITTFDIKATFNLEGQRREMVLFAIQRQ